MNLSRRQTFTLIVGLLSSTVAFAEDKLPTGEEVLDRYVEVTGGTEARQGHGTSITTVNMDIQPTGISAKMVVFSSRPKFYVRSEIPNVGLIEIGYDGDVMWERQPFQAPRLIEGEEKAVRMTENDDTADPREQYEKYECVGAEQVNGEDCYKLLLTKKGVSKPVTSFYSKASGLIVKQVMSTPSQFGEITMDVFPSDWRDYGGLKLAHKTVVKMIGIEQTLTIEDIEADADIPAEKFELPDDVKQLVASQQ